MRPSIGAVSLLGLGALGTASAVAALSMPAMPKSSPERPKMVLDALKSGEPIYYFAIGSNLSRTHLEGRSICGKKIHVLSMEPAIVPEYRMAFNFMAFPPLEPAMGSLEPLGTGDEKMALLDYERQECHGALIRLSAEDYERVHFSEGGGLGRQQGYEEIVVTAVPYDRDRPPVRAVAYRAREYMRREKDPAPSRRYMNILRDGAKELGLKPCYQKWLEDHPVQTMSPALKAIARHHLLFSMVTRFVLKIPFLVNVQNWYLYHSYIPPTQTSIVRRAIGETVSGLIMLPGASIGLLMRGLMELTGTMPPNLRPWLNQ